MQWKAHVHSASARDVFHCDHIFKLLGDRSLVKYIFIYCFSLQLPICAEEQDSASGKEVTTQGEAC